MRRMKPWIALAATMAIVLAGCGKAEEPAVQEEKENGIVVEEVTQTEEVEVENIPLSVQTTTNHKTYYFDEGDQAYLYLQYCDVTLEGSQFENLKRNVENWSMETSEVLRGLYAEFEKTAKEEAEDNGEEFFGYTLYQTVSTARIDERVLSLLDDTYQYTGGANGMYYREGVNFDSKTGKQLELRDILVDYNGFAEEAKQRMLAELKLAYGEELFDDYEQTITNMWQGENGPEWYLDATGIVIVVQQYEVGPYSVGMPQIHMPYKEFGRYIKEAYLPSTGESVVHIEKNQEVYLELPNVGETLPMMLQFEYKEYDTNCALWLGNDKTTLSDFATMEDAYLIRNGEEVYCLVELDMASDDYVTYVFRLTNGVIDEVAQVSGAIDGGNVNAQQVSMESWVNMLGTYGGVKTYRFDENKGFTTADDEYLFLKNEQVLTATADLQVLIDGVESTLPSGSHIVLNATDGASYVRFTIQETGQMGTLKVQHDKENYRILVNGISEYDCFEMLPYAG